MLRLIIQHQRFFKYAIVGSIGTFIDLGIYSCVIYFLGADKYLIAGFLGFIVAVVNNFLLNKFWTFQNKATNIKKQFSIFLVISTIGLLLNLIVLKLSIENFGINEYLAKLLASAIVLSWNYYANQKFTFRVKIKQLYWIL